jgi:hypothetical protein
MTRVLVVAPLLLLLLAGRVAGADRPAEADEPVISLSFRGAHRAYPVSVFSARPVLNDVVGQQEVVVFHDRDRSLTAAWFRTVFGDPIEFSGKTQGNVADDLTTMTRWDLTTGVAVAGNLAGQKLVPLPVNWSSKSAWRAKHPDAPVFPDPEP